MNDITALYIISTLLGVAVIALSINVYRLWKIVERLVRIAYKQTSKEQVLEIMSNDRGRNLGGF